jgi:hypothetical protein
MKKSKLKLLEISRFNSNPTLPRLYYYCYNFRARLGYYTKRNFNDEYSLDDISFYQNKITLSRRCNSAPGIIFKLKRFRRIINKTYSNRLNLNYYANKKDIRNEKKNNTFQLYNT